MSSFDRTRTIVRRSVILLIRGYQCCISPVLGNHCRFHPSCSSYAIQAVDRHGILTGLKLSFLRLMRCGPWHPGGFDPVPDQEATCSHLRVETSCR